MWAFFPFFCADSLASINLILVGPFEFLSGDYKKHKKDTCYLTYWRYYYDPPEFLTVLIGDKKKQFHIGYYRYVLYINVLNFYSYYSFGRDDPNEAPNFVAFNEAKDSCQIEPKGENLFSALK